MLIPLPVQYDFTSGVDFSLLPQVTADQINQGINQIAPLSNVGGILCFSSLNGTKWPSKFINPRFTRYLWLDTYTTPAKLKQYDGSGLDTYAHWMEVASGVSPVGTITSVVSSWTLPAAAPWVLTVPHGLSSVPNFVHAVLFCEDDDAGYITGDEVDFGTGYSVVGTPGYPIANIVFNATNIIVIFGADLIERRIYNKSTGEVTVMTNSKWKVKFYLV